MNPTQTQANGMATTAPQSSNTAPKSGTYGYTAALPTEYTYDYKTGKSVPTGRVFGQNPPPQSTTTLTNVNKQNQVPNIIATTDSLTKSGISTDAQGNAQYANGTVYQTTPTETTPNTNTKTNLGGYFGETYIPAGGDIPLDANGNPVTLSERSPSDQQITDNLNALKAQADAITASQIDNIKAQFEQLIQQQQVANETQLGGVKNALLTGGVTGKGSSAQYAPISSQNIIAAQTKYGLQQIADLQSKENAAIIQAQQAGLNQDYQLMNELNQQIRTVRDEKIKAATELSQKIAAQNQKQAEIAIQASRDSAIADLVSKGISDPKQILDYLNYSESGKQIGDFTAKEVSDTLKNIASNLGTDVKGMSADAQEFYNLQKMPNGLPASILALPDQASQLAAYIKLKKTGSISGTGGTGGTTGVETSPMAVIDKNSQSILSQTGLSIPAFNFITQGSGALTRMDAKQRLQYMNEAQKWATNNDIDLSTFQSQFKAYNEVLQNNIERANQTKIFGGEITGTVDQFIDDIGDEFGNLKVSNIAKLWKGQQVNDPLVQKYAFDLQTLKNDLAGYYAASRGAKTPTESDIRDAENVIKTGISKRSAQAFKEAITDNEEKVTGVVNNAVDNARKSVWELFGVGSNYKSSTASQGSIFSQLQSAYQNINGGSSGQTIDWSKAK